MPDTVNATSSELMPKAAIELAVGIQCLLADAQDDVDLSTVLEILATFQGWVVSSVIGSEQRRATGADLKRYVESVVERAIEDGDRQESRMN